MENFTESDAITLIAVPWDWRLILQLCLAIIGILGNSLVIHVYRSNKDLKGKPTNMFIAALAVADLVTSIAIIPYPSLSRVPQNGSGSFYCKVVFSSNIMWISIVASILTLTLLSVERYVAVGFPIRYKRIFTKNNTIIIILCIWLFGFAMNTFGYYETFVVGEQCVHIIVSVNFQKFLGVAVFLVEYLIPMIIMLATNIRTIHILQKQAKSFSGKGDKNSSGLTMLRARRRVVYMLFVVIMAFIICWSPDQVAFLGFNLGLVPFEFAFGDMYRAFIALAFSNSCLNPAIYIITNRNFRKAFYNLLPSRDRASGASTDTKSTALFDTPLEDGENVVAGTVNFGAVDDNGKVIENASSALATVTLK